MPAGKREVSNSLCLFRKQGFGECFQLLPLRQDEADCKCCRFQFLTVKPQVVLLSLIEPTKPKQTLFSHI